MTSNRQVQIDAAGAVGSLLRATVESHPTPPRSVNIPALLLAMYRGKVMNVFVLAVAAAGLFVITFFQPGSTISVWSLRLLWAFGFLFTVLAPFRGLLKIVRYGRDGLAAQATVTEARSGFDRSSRPEVRGRRVVHHPRLGDFGDEFTLVAPWAASIARDVTLELLVAPDRPKTWAILGPDELTSSESADSAPRGAYITAGPSPHAAEKE